jgi:hypothetical protein
MKDNCKYNFKDIYKLECGIVILPLFVIHHIMRVQINQILIKEQYNTFKSADCYIPYSQIETDLFGDVEFTKSLSQCTKDSNGAYILSKELKEVLNYFFPFGSDTKTCQYSLMLNKDDFIKSVKDHIPIRLKSGSFEISLDSYGCYNTILSYSALPCLKSKSNFLGLCGGKSTPCDSAEIGITNSYFEQKNKIRSKKRKHENSIRADKLIDEDSDDDDDVPLKRKRRRKSNNDNRVREETQSSCSGDEESDVSHETRILRDFMGYNDNKDKDTCTNYDTDGSDSETPILYDLSKSNRTYLQCKDMAIVSRDIKNTQKSVTDSDPFYGLMEDLEGFKKYKNGLSSFRTVPMQVSHHPLSSNIDSMPASDHTRYLQYLEARHIIQGFDMNQNEIKETCLTADGISQSDPFFRNHTYPYEKVYNNAKSKTYDNGYNSKSLGDLSKKFLRPYEDQISERFLNREIHATGVYYTRTRSSPDPCGIFQQWDSDEFGFIPFIVFINGTNV